MTSSPSTNLLSQSPANSRHRVRGDIQGLRAIAVLAVVVFHAGLPLPGGFSGVDVFFVISGYVITSAITRRMSHGRFRLRDFYQGRIRRLLPALATMLVLVMAASAVLGTIGSMGSTARTGGAAALVNANTYLMLFEKTGYFDAAATVNPLLHTWSLSVEEQFYLVVPGLLVIGWLATRRRHVKTPTRIVTIIIGIASFLVMLNLCRHTDPSSLQGKIDFYSPITRGWEFAAGAVLVVLPDAWRLSRNVATIAALTGVFAIGIGFLEIHEGVTYPSMITLLPVIGTMLLIAAGTHHPRNPVSAALARRPATWVGDLSYSWYLWHWPFIVFAGVLFTESATWKVVGAAASLPIAWVSYRFIENPVRYRLTLSVRGVAILAIVCTLIPVLVAGGLLTWFGVVKSMPSINPFALHQDKIRNCDGPESLDNKPAACTWPVNNARGRAVLVGDSLAGQYTEGFTSAMNKAGITAQVATLSGCPFLDWGTHRVEAAALGISTDPVCTAYVRHTMTDLIHHPADIVVLTSSAQRFVPGDAVGAGPERDQTRAALITTVHADMIRRLSDAGSRVALIGPLAKFHGWGPYVDGPFKEASAVSVMTIGSPFVPSMSQSELDKEIASATEIERRAATQGGAAFLDMRPLICGSDGCTGRDARGWVYADFEHLTIPASFRVEPVFAELARALG